MIAQKSMRVRVPYRKVFSELSKFKTKPNTCKIVPQKKYMAENQNLIDLLNGKTLRKKYNDEKFAIMPENFFIIYYSINKRTKFATARNRLGHTLLFIWGLRIGNLKYVTMKQIDNLFNQRDSFVKSTKTYKNKFIFCPYVPEIERYLQPARKDYEFIKECEKNGHPKFFKFNRNNKNDRFRSELWGKTDRSYYTHIMNDELKEAGKLLSPQKRITSHSYRRGFAIVAARKYGIKAAQFLLEHEHVSGTEHYVEEVLGTFDKRKILKEIFSIKESSEALDEINDNITLDESLNNEIEKLVE